MKISKNTIIIILVILNVGIVAFFLLMQPKKGDHLRNPKRIIIERLSLNSDQQDQFEVLVKEFSIDMKRLHNAVRSDKKTVYKRILDHPEHKDSLLNVLGQKLIAVDEKIVQHLFDIKSILNESQLTQFDELVNHIDRVFGPRPPKKRFPNAKRPTRQ
jgi:hypothetical protein